MNMNFFGPRFEKKEGKGGGGKNKKTEAELQKEFEELLKKTQQEEANNMKEEYDYHSGRSNKNPVKRKDN